MIWLGLAVLSMLLNLWQWAAGRRFPLRQSVADGFAPPLSVLRPLKGCDAETRACLESWFTQEYPAEVELLFGVASADDPVCGVVRDLIQKFPGRPARLIICQPVLGPNAKVSSLCHLAGQARFAHWVISDQDVFVPARFLQQLVRPLEHETAGLVNCFYIFPPGPGLAMRLEAVAVNADFWTQVLQGNMLKPMDFALGAAMATRKSQVQAIGGFEALLDYLADDYQLGHRIAKTGARLEICPAPVECRSEPQTAAEVWRHQLRWARTIRVCQPLPYFFSILSNGTIWALLFLLGSRSAAGLAVMALALAVRSLTAWSNSRRLTGQSAWSAAFLAPVKDLLQVLIWALAFAGNQITWRGQRFRVDRGGKLTPLA